MESSESPIQQMSKLLKDRGFAGFLQPVNDEFQGEYTPDYAKRLEFMCGFSGSAGLGLFLAEPVEGKHAVLFTDGRYTLQAAQEVDNSLMQVCNSSDIPPVHWVKQQLSGKIAYDPWLHTHAQLAGWQRAVAGSDIEFVPVEANLVDTLWQQQPAPPAEPIRAHPIEFSGKDSCEKVAAVMELMQQRRADYVLLALPDGINWLLNVRGSDIPYNPLVLGFLLLDRKGKMQWFIYQPKRENHHSNNELEILNINDIDDKLKATLKKGNRIWMDASVSASAFFSLAEEVGAEVVDAADPTLLLKACKNKTEIEGMRKAHQRDGVALTKFLRWMQDSLPRQMLHEMDALNKLEEFRQKESENYLGPSFNTIAGSGRHGAIVHYRVDEDSNRIIGDGEIFLVDSGGQYPDGTTDVTRTIINGKPTKEMKDRFTRVLKGHIALATARFPQGTTGGQLDVLARQYLWEIGCDYDHGTGHGVGSYLCVHEGPQRISKRGSDIPLMEGMVLSNEPGYYKDGAYGIRIENLVLVVKVGETEKGKPLLGFEDLTLAPIDGGLIDEKMLTAAEKDWLDAYHARVEANMKAASS